MLTNIGNAANALAEKAKTAAAEAAGGRWGDSMNSAARRRERGLVVEPDAKDAYDEMLHRDARFWDEIAARKERAAARRRASASANGAGVTWAAARAGRGRRRQRRRRRRRRGGLLDVRVASTGYEDEDDDDDAWDPSRVQIEFDLPGGGVGCCHKSAAEIEAALLQAARPRAAATAAAAAAARHRRRRQRGHRKFHVRRRVVVHVRGAHGPQPRRRLRPFSPSSSSSSSSSSATGARTWDQSR